MVTKKGFNLLKTQVEPQTLWTKVYKWTTTTARALMVFVELIIVLSFGVRVVVDLQFKNLNKDIASKEEVLIILKDSELRLRNIQDKVRLYEKIWTESDYYAETYAEIVRILPEDIQELQIVLKDNELIITGFTFANNVEFMETEFKNSNYFTKTELINFESRGDASDSFTIRTKLNNIPKRMEVVI